MLVSKKRRPWPIQFKWERANTRAWLRAWAIQFIPRNLYDAVRYLTGQFPRTFKTNYTERLFLAASEAPMYMHRELLDALQRKYSYPREYGYDAQTLEARGSARARQLINLPGAQGARTFLELGCWDGMVCAALGQKGKRATGIDYRAAGFDPRAAGENVNLLEMDAANLTFAEEIFDFVFSYDAFEHFESPERVLREAIRVTNIGGYIYLDFGPLYYSPYGEHAYRSVTIPYCQLLFCRKDMNDFVEKSGLPSIDFDHVNGWSVERFRALWSRYAKILKQVRYREYGNWSHLDLIRQYPSCFKSKSDCFDNFVVSHIKVLFEKTANLSTSLDH